MTTTAHVPPQDTKAEQSALGAMLITAGAVTAVLEEVGLEPADMYEDRHQAILACVASLHAAAKPVDALSVNAALSGHQRELIEAPGGKTEDYLAQLAATTSAPGNAKHHAEIVKEKARLRQVIRAAQKASEAAHEGTLNGEVDGLSASLEIVKAGGTAIATTQGTDVRLRVPRFLDASGMLPTRSNTVLFGQAGLGKTLYGLAQCAAVTKGRLAGLDGAAPVLISSEEDDPEAVLAPRLVAADADLSLVHFVSGLSLPSQVSALARRAKTLGAKLILIDPIAAHLDADIDSHRDASVRSALRPLGDAAMELDLSVLVIAHPNKATGGTGLDRISGSGAFGNAARSVIVFGLDPADPDGETGNRRIVGHLKNNVGKKAQSVCLEIETCPVETEDGTATVPRLRVTGLSDHTALDVLSSPTGEERTERDDAREFLTSQLAGGPIRSKELKMAVEQNGAFNWRTAERAKRDLGIKAVQAPDGWYWLPPGQETLEGDR